MENKTLIQPRRSSRSSSVVNRTSYTMVPTRDMYGSDDSLHDEKAEYSYSVDHSPPVRHYGNGGLTSGPRPLMSGPRSASFTQARHISLQSRVESLVADSIWDEPKEPISDLQAVYNRGRSTSLLLDYGSTPKLPLHDSIRDDGELGEHDGPDPDLHRDDTSLHSRPAKADPLNISTLHEVLFVGVVIMAQFLTLAGLGQSMAPMAIIADGLGVTNPGETAWFAAAYSLTVGTFILISGRLGDVLGHKRVFVFGFFFLGCWSAFAGFSAYTGLHVFFDVCRGFQGIGAALLAPNALALLGRAYPPGIKKNLVFALFGAMAPWGFVCGALFASLFAQLTWWPWAFWSYGIAAWLLAAFALLVVPRALAHEAQFAGRDPAAPPPGMDYTGSCLGVTGLVLVNVAFNNGPLFGWGAPHVYFLLILGVAALAAFLWVEARAVSPILPVAALSGPVAYTMALVGIGWGSFGIWIYYSWRFLEELRGQTPLTVSAEYVPALICGLLAAGVTGFMLTHTPVSFTMLVAMLAFFLGQLITATQPLHQPYWAQMFFAILIMPFGESSPFFQLALFPLTQTSFDQAWTCPSPPAPSSSRTTCRASTKGSPPRSSTRWSTTASRSRSASRGPSRSRSTMAAPRPPTCCSASAAPGGRASRWPASASSSAPCSSAGPG